MSFNTKYVISILLMIVFGAVALYVGGWIMFVQPILEACQHFDAGTLTGTMVGITVLKCLFASTVGGIIFWIGCFLGGIVSEF